MPSRWRLLLVAFAFAVAACEPSARDMDALTGPMPEAPPAIAVRDTVHHLSLAETDGILREADWRKIDDFLTGAAAERPQTAHLAIAADAMSRNIGTVIRRAVGLGFERDNITTLALTGGDATTHKRHSLVLTVRRYAAVLPNCPQSAHLNLIDGDNMVSSDWGCATISTYGLQVTDPRDLMRGRAGAETDAVLTTAAIRRLETDKVKKLNNLSTTPASSGANQ